MVDAACNLGCHAFGCTTTTSQSMSTVRCIRECPQTSLCHKLLLCTAYLLCKVCVCGVARVCEICDTDTVAVLTTPWLCVAGVRVRWRYTVVCVAVRVSVCALMHLDTYPQLFVVRFCCFVVFVCICVHTLSVFVWADSRAVCGRAVGENTAALLSQTRWHLFIHTQTHGSVSVLVWACVTSVILHPRTHKQSR